VYASQWATLHKFHDTNFNAPDFRLPATHAALVAAKCSAMLRSFSIRRKAAIDNMLQIIEGHPKVVVYADVFEHPPPRLHLDA